MAAEKVTAGIRDRYGGQSLQHVEPTAPPERTREVAALTLAPLPKPAERQQEARKAREVATGRPQRVMELDPSPREGWCRILGCGRTSQARGLCSSCYWVATHRDGLDHLMLPARCMHSRIDAGAAIRAQVHAAVEGEPGIGPKAMATGLALPISSVKHHLRRLVAEGLVVADHRGTYRSAGAAPVAARNATDRLEELVRARGRIRRSEAARILGMDERTIGSAVGNLRLRGRLLGVGKGRAGIYLEAAPSTPQRL